MKKYWKSLGVTVFIIIVLGMFYFGSTSYSSTLPKFAFEQVNGEEAASQDLLINGNLNFSMLDGESFQIDQDGTTYLRDEGFFKRLEGHYVSENFDYLREEYPGFMRGKVDVQQYYFEDDTVIAYADAVSGMFSIRPNEFEVDILDKATGDRTHFSAPIPEHENIWYMEVKGIKVIDKTLYLITQADVARTGYMGEIYKYTFDLSSETLTESELIDSIEEKEPDEYSHFNTDIVFSKDPSETKYLIVRKEIRYPAMDSGEDVMEETVVHGLNSYDIVTNKKNQIDVPPGKGNPITIFGDTIVFVDFTKNKINLSTYNIMDQKVEQETEIGVDQSFDYYGDLYHYSLIQDNTLYFSTPYYGEGALPSIGIVDLANLEVAYLGKVVRDEQIMSDQGFWNDLYLNVYMDGPDLRRVPE